MVSWIRGFAGEYHARTSSWPVIYTGYYWWTSCTGNFGSLGSNDPLWIACYCGGPGAIPAGWGHQTVWQYAASGTFPGDQDIFNGTSAGLRKLAAGPGPAHGPITSALAGKCVDDHIGSSANGTKIDLWSCNRTLRGPARIVISGNSTFWDLSRMTDLPARREEVNSRED
jgi:hypothetical protein